MAESSDPRRRRPSVPPSDDNDSYDLADDDSSDSSASASASVPADDEVDEAPRAKGSAAPVAPLPRLWKTEPDPEPSQTSGKKDEKADAKGGSTKADSQGSTRSGGASRSKESSGSDKKGSRGKETSEKSGRGVLVEETPNLDTYETRRTIRIGVGLALTGVFCLVIFLVLRPLFRGAPQADDGGTTPESAPVATNTSSRESIEQEARALFERARDAAKRNNTDQAVTLLDRVVKSYPNTGAAREAKEALARPEQNLPLFIDRPTVVATAADPPPQAAVVAPPPKVVGVTAPTPGATKGQVGLVQPANPSEAGPSPTTEEPTTGRLLPKRFRAKPGTQTHASGWPLEIVGDRDGAIMVLVPGGEFLMGRDDGEPAERPAHTVKLSTYYIDRHEVTVRLFDLFQKEAGRRTERDRALAREPLAPSSTEESPVVMVSAKEARDYATWAGKRLPTEAQWEMAARGTDGRIYPWGTEAPAWAKTRDPKKLDPVMSFDADRSPFGAFDMAANAWEWTKDYYDPRYYQLFKSSVPTDPSGPSNRGGSQELVIRGGSRIWAVTKREGLRYDKRLPFLGFRCVLAVEGADNGFQAPAATPAPAPAANEAPPLPGVPVNAPPPF